MKCLTSLFLVCFSVQLMENCLCLIPTKITVGINTIADCDPSAVVIGTECTIELEVMIPTDNSTDFRIHIMSPNETTNMILGKPSFQYGSNYDMTSANDPWVEMISSHNDLRFTEATMDFGKGLTNNRIVNSGSSSSNDSNTITVTFKVGIIDDDYATDTSSWLIMSSTYYEGDQIWLGGQEFTLVASSPVSSPVLSTTFVSDLQAGSWGTATFDVSFSATYFSMMISATTNKISITICSIHIQDGSEFVTLGENKEFAVSDTKRLENSADLDLGFILKKSSSTNGKITVLVYYRKSPKMAIETEGSDITVDAKVAFGQLSGNQNKDTSKTVTQPITFTNSIQNSTDFVDAEKFVVTSETSPNGSVNIYKYFNYTLQISFPDTDFYGPLVFKVKPEENDVTLFSRMRICSVVPIFSGENIPCPKCMTQDEVIEATSDSFIWTYENFIKRRLRTYGNGKKNLNTFALSLIGQVLESDLNTEDSEIKIPVSLKFGQTVLYVNMINVTVGTEFNFTTSDQINILPEFSVLHADVNESTFFYDTPRPIYIDFFTKPEAIYQEMNLEVYVPAIETNGDFVPYGKICNIEIVYVGKYASCIKSEIGYQKRFGDLNTDTAIISLDSFCNTASSDFANTASYNQYDSLIRFLMYFTVVPHVQLPSTDYLALGVEFNSELLYVGQFELEPSDDPPKVYDSADTLQTAVLSPSLASIYDAVYDVSQTVEAGKIGTIEYFFKTPPNSLYSYIFNAEITQQPTTAGSMSICTIQISEAGKNLPCASSYIPGHKELFQNNLKYSDQASTGILCNKNKYWTANNPNMSWDDDSVRVQMIVKPFRDASGPSKMKFSVNDPVLGSALASADYTVDIPIDPLNIVLSSAPLENSSNSSVEGSNPSESLNLTHVDSYRTVYQGQTTIIRFDLMINETKSYELELFITSNVHTLLPGIFEIQKLFVLSAGHNYPCVQANTGITTYTVHTSDGRSFYKGAKLTLGDIDYVPVDITNLTSSTISFEAFVRFSTVAPDTSFNNIEFQITPLLDGEAYTHLTKSISGFSFGDLSDFNSTFPNRNETFNFTLGSLLVSTVGIRETIKVNITLGIPEYNNVKVKVKFSCNAPDTRLQFGFIKDFKVLSAGKNVDGIMSDANNDVLIPTYSRVAPGNGFNESYDTVELKLGVVTNTGYGSKTNNYDSLVDNQIVLEAEFYLVDGAHMIDGTYTYTANVEFNSNSSYSTAQDSVTLARSYSEKPVVSLDAKFLTDTSIAFLSETEALVMFNISHLDESSANAINLRVGFFLPPYVVIQSIENTDISDVTYSVNGSAVFFQLDTLYLDQKMYCEFKVKIDPDNDYATIVNNFGRSPPSMLPIPYLAYLNKLFISGDTTINGHTFYTDMSYIYYKPETVTLDSLPLNSLLSSTDKCSITSSVEDSSPHSVESSNTGWRTGWRSLHWYTSGSTYLTVSFKNLKNIYQLSLNQLIGAFDNYQMFSAYKISYSTDGVSYVEFPEKKLSILNSDPIIYSVPSKFITCRYLRIHITNVEDPTILASKNTGLVLNGIYGEQNADSTAQLPCFSTSYNADYTPTSFLYIPSLSIFYVCDENTHRTSSDCYKSTDSTPTTWQVLPKKIATITFWVKDIVTEKEYLYGIANDKTNHLRSDDEGLTWKYVTTNEYTTMNSVKTDAGRYECAVSESISISNILDTTVPSTSWSLKTTGVFFGGDRRLDWFN